MRHVGLMTALTTALMVGCTDKDTTTDSGGGSLDCDTPSTWYVDVDGDGYGEETDSQLACEAPAGFVAEFGDCNDADDSVNPGAAEICDDLDNDCNEAIDDQAIDAIASYSDDDGDGYGDPSTEVLDCDVASGAVKNDRDCNDSDANTFPGAEEVCDFEDQDCDDSIDEEADGATEYHPDADEDGFGDSETSTWACEAPPEGHTLDGTDCDDGAADINPDGQEACDGYLDEDCDGQVDEADAILTSTFYADNDNDGFGNPLDSIDACTVPSGYSANNNDCDDADPDEYPGAVWYADIDGDTYGDPSTESTCERGTPSDVVTNDDCDDTDPSVHPSAPEICDGQLNDCLTPGLPSDESDADGDGYVACPVDPSGWDGGNIFGGEDCDDTDPTEYPGVTWYSDGDGDGYGDDNDSNSCERANTSDVTDNTDCNDSDSGINPTATEVCDSTDQDCDSSIDEGVTTTYFLDNDGDAYGTSDTTTESCSQPPGYAENDDDCDDGDSSVNPLATEVCDGSIDEDCDSSIDEGLTTTYYRDADSDGYGTPATTKDQCTTPTGYTTDSSDCDDSDSDVNPSATEICDGQDNDCDSSTSEDGMAAFTNNASGVTIDVTSSMTPSSGDPVASYSASAAGDLAFCDGTWNVALDITKDVNIRGMSGDRDAVVLDGAGSARLITIDKSGISVTLEDLTLTDGYATSDLIDVGYDSGGAIGCQGTSTSLTGANLVVQNSYAGLGGAVSSDGCDVTFTDSDFTGNSAQYGGMGFLEGSDVVLTDSNITSNTASAQGGAIYLYDTTTSGDASLELSDSLVSGNSALYYGGVYASYYYNTLDISCDGSKSTTTGILSNSTTGPYDYTAGLYIYGNNTQFSSYKCDFGTSAGGDLNDNYGLGAGGFDYEPGDDEIFDCDSAGCGTVSEYPIGDNSYSFGGTTPHWWVVLEGTGPATLESFDFNLRSSSGSCTIDYYVMSASSTSSGTAWDYVWSGSSTLSMSSSFSSPSSGVINLPIEEGLYYALVASSSCSYSVEVEYGYGMTAGTDLGLGDLVGAYYSMDYSSSNFTSGTVTSSTLGSYIWLASATVHEL